MCFENIFRKKKTTIHVLTIYTSPAGDFNQFLVTIDNILKFLMNFKTEVIIHGDINVNYLTDSKKKSKYHIKFL